MEYENKFVGLNPINSDSTNNVSNAKTAKFDKLDNNTAYGYIREIENRCGGKLNLETLEIEKQNEFKDGDIVTQGVLKGVNVCIIKNCIDKIDNKYNYYARYNTQDKEINYDDWSHISPFAKFATDSEKQQLFEALAKENKAWEQRRYEIAKDVAAGLVQRPNSTYDSVVNSAIKIADKLIERLKEK